MGMSAHMLDFCFVLVWFRIITYLQWQMIEARKTMTKLFKKQIANVSLTFSFSFFFFNLAFLLIVSSCYCGAVICFSYDGSREGGSPPPCELQGNLTHKQSCCKIILPSSCVAAAPSVDRIKGILMTILVNGYLQALSLSRMISPFQLMIKCVLTIGRKR